MTLSTTQRTVRPKGFYAKAALEMVNNGTTRPSVYLRQHRIFGPKPWGGGETTAAYSVRCLPILAAVEAAKQRPYPHHLELKVFTTASGSRSVTLDGSPIRGRKVADGSTAHVLTYQVTAGELLRALD